MRKHLGKAQRKKQSLPSPNKSETKKLVHLSPTTRLKLSWEPLVLEDMEVMDSNTVEISAKAGSLEKNPPFVWCSTCVLV